jgi:hypothetical protein
MDKEFVLKRQKPVVFDGGARFFYEIMQEVQVMVAQ